MRWLARLDGYGTDDPDFNEGHPEDRCPLCDWPVVDHAARGELVYFGERWVASSGRAKWPHRRHALIAILLNR